MTTNQLEVLNNVYKQFQDSIDEFEAYSQANPAWIESAMQLLTLIQNAKQK